MRVFIGVQAPEWLRGTVRLGRDEICASAEAWTHEKWVPEKNLHMTVKFMGDIPQEAVGHLPLDLASALSDVRPFALPVKDLLYPLGGSAKTTLLMSTFSDPTGEFSRLVSVVEDVACAYGVVPESRKQLPHVTWARSRRPLALHDRERLNHTLGSLATSDSIQIDELTVFKSVLTKNHPQYKIIGSAQLAG